MPQTFNAFATESGGSSLGIAILLLSHLECFSKAFRIVDYLCIRG